MIVMTTQKSETLSRKRINQTWYNFLLLDWLTPTMFLGAKKPLESDDLLLLSDQNEASSLSTVLAPFWKEVEAYLQDPVKTTNRPSLFKVLFRQFAVRFFLAVLALSCSVACGLTVPTFVKQVILYLTPFVPRDILILQNGYSIAFTLFALQVGSTLFGRSAEQILRKVEINVKTILIGAIYEKSLRLSQKASAEFTQGQILNLINVDAEKIAQAINGTSGMWATPIQVIVAVILLGQLLGYAVWAGAGTLFGVLFLQGTIVGFLAKFQSLFLKAGDRRLKSLREMLYGMKIVKLRSLEDFFNSRVSEIRDSQISALSKFYTVQVFFVGLLQVTPVAMPIVAFVAYSSVGGTVDASVIFPALTLFNLLFQPLLVLPTALTSLVTGIVSWNRVRTFLIAEEATPWMIESRTEESVAININKARFEWSGVKKVDENEEKKKNDVKTSRWNKRGNPKEAAEKEKVEESAAEQVGFVLKAIDMYIPKSGITAIVGSVGSGKSSLLSAIISEMPKKEGSVHVYGSIAYCDQQSWILTETIQANVLFNHVLDEKKLIRALEATCLDTDLESFPAGIMTEIGEKGVNLSGGQKARVALARALYQDADIYLLDDPLSALDASVGEKVFSRTIKGALASKTVILVTHQLHFLQQVDNIVVLDDGQIVEIGSFNQLLSKPDGHLTRMMKNYKIDDALASDQKEKIAKADKPTDEVAKQGGGAIIAEEDRFTGAVQWNTYWSYAQACGGSVYLTLVVLSALLAQTARLMTDLWLSWWTSNKYNLDVSTNLRVYAGLGGSQIVFALILNTSILSGGYLACKYFHKAALNRLVKAPMSFFDSQPIGRILNRMSKDVESIDQLIWLFLFLTIISSTGLLSTFVLMVYTSRIMLALGVPLVIIYYFILKYYQNTNRELKRLESVQRSPLYSHVSESLQGIASVKAFRAENRFVERQRQLMDFSNTPTYSKLMGVIWVNIRIELLASSVTLVLVILGVTGWVEQELIGLALTYAIGLQGLINLLLLSFSQLESELNAVERLDLYANLLPQENALMLPNDPDIKEWPSKGVICVQNLELVYPSRPEFPVLRNLSFEVKAGEKVGVVGRTGSGKSSLMTALFRLVEPSKGTIHVDSIDLASIGLRTLRSRLQIIPQEPVLFTGSIRSNLDVESEYTDAELWEVLDLIGLKTYVSSLPEKLDSGVAENGENLSVGQRQLLCLGRAILRQPKVLVMDEATASVDREADELIQRSIKTHFANSTVLSIAHRLNTIADFDRVLVLQDGQMLEYDTPHRLLSDRHSVFSQLADATGTANAALLREIARAKHDLQLNEQ